MFISYMQFVDFKMGEESGYIRYEEPEAAQKARAAAVLAVEGGLTVKNYIAHLEPVSGMLLPLFSPLCGFLSHFLLHNFLVQTMVLHA